MGAVPILMICSFTCGGDCEAIEQYVFGQGYPNPIAKVTKILDKSLSLNDFLYFIGGIYAYVRFSSHYLALG